MNTFFNFTCGLRQLNGDTMNGGPKTIHETNKTLKVNLGGDGSHSCKRISDFMIFIKIIIAIYKIM